MDKNILPGLYRHLHIPLKTLVCVWSMAVCNMNKAASAFFEDYKHYDYTLGINYRYSQYSLSIHEMYMKYSHGKEGLWLYFIKNYVLITGGNLIMRQCL